jgi:cysteine synthase A
MFLRFESFDSPDPGTYSRGRFRPHRPMPLPRQVASSALDLIGNTPVVELRRMQPVQAARIVAKLESQNPGGSVKDRICLAMIEAAERSGELRPGGTIVEPTSGNTGIGLAIVAAAKGYRLILTMPDTMSEERRGMLRAYGAELELTSDSKGMHEAVRRAEQIVAENPGYFMPQQFKNPANPATHRDTTAREVLAQCPELDAFVAGVGTGGTITGVGSALKCAKPSVLVVAVEPSASPVLSGGEPGFHGIQGIGAGFAPDVLDMNVVDRVLCISDDDAARYARELARQEGILVGISSGANLAAAMRVAEELGEGRTVLTVFCDTGQRYLTTQTFDRDGI